MDDRDARFVRIAVELGWVSPHQVEQVTKGAPPSKPIGQIFVERGILSLDQLFDVMRRLDTSTIAAVPTTPGLSGGLDARTLVGQRFDGRYALLEELGRGGMGIVFRANDEHLGRVVAIKVLRDVAGASPAILKRFQREAQAISKLRHPSIVSVHDVGTFMGMHYFTMDYVEGKSLDELMRRSLGTAHGVAILEQVARAVHHAHRQGVVHRDLKPGNVLVDGARKPYLLDFGLAWTVGGESHLTITGHTVGTPCYMSPEQARGDVHTIGASTDIYSLGVILYELLTGRVPFLASNAMDTYRLILDTDALPPRELRPGIPVDLEAICLKAMAKEPRHRYPSAEAFADDLARYLKGEPILARPTSGFAKLRRRVRRHRVPLAIAALVLLSAAALVLALTARQKVKEDPERVRTIAAVVAQAGELINRALVKAYSADPDVGTPAGEAVEMLDRLLKRYPDAHEAHYQRGRALFVREEWDDSEQSLSRSITLMPTAPAHYLRGRIHVHEYLSIAMRSSLTTDTQKNDAPRADARKRAALEDFKRAIELGGLAEEKLLAEAFRAFLEDRPQEVVETCSRVLAAATRKEDVYLLRGTAFARLDRLADAEKDLGEVIRLRPNHAEALAAHADVLSRMSRYADAITDLDRVLAMHPTAAAALATRSRCLTWAGRHEEAVRDAEKGVALDPSVYSYVHLAAARVHGGHPQGAVEAYDRALSLVPEKDRAGYAGTYGDRGWAKMQAGDARGAIEDYDRALAAREDPNAYSNRADLRKAQGDLRGALEDYTSALRIRPNLGPTYLFRADLHRAMGNADAMLADLEQAIQRTTPDPRFDRYFVGACVLRARHSLSQGQPEPAMADFDRALQRQPDSVDALMNRGLAYHALKRYSDCAKDLRRVFELQPDAPVELRRILDDAASKAGE